MNRLYRPVVKGRDLGLFLFTMVASIGAVVAISEPFRLWFRSLWVLVRSLFE